MNWEAWIMRRGVLFTVLAALLLPTASRAQEQRLETLIARHLFSPKVIMESQARLKLTQEQAEAIRARTDEFQQSISQQEWNLEGKTQDLVLLVAEEDVDVAQTLALFDEILDLEAQIKRSHLHLLIDLKNLLTPEQQGVLEEIMEELLRRGERGGGSQEGLTEDDGVELV